MSLAAPAATVVAPLMISALDAVWPTDPVEPTVRLPVPVAPVVLMLPRILAPVPVMATLPPLVLIEPAAEKVVAAVAFKLVVSAEAVEEIAALMSILLPAFRVSVRAVPPV